MIRKLCIAIIAVFMNNNTVTGVQLLLVVAALAMSLVAQLVARPYKRKLANHLEIVELTVRLPVCVCVSVCVLVRVCVRV